MKKGKYAKRTPVVKTLAVAMVLVTLIGCAIGGTLAWLTDETQQVVNTFTVGNIKIKLDETNVDDKVTGVIRDSENSYKMIPGHVIDKDPVATVLADSEDCWLFVKISESENLDDYIAYAIADGWEEVEITSVSEIVIARKVMKKTTNQAFHILRDGRFTDSMDPDVENDSVTVEWANDQVGVKPSVTEQMMEALTEETYPTLTFTAYASQLYKTNGVEFTADAAWAIVSRN